MGILQITTGFAGQDGVQPQIARIVTTDDYTTITTAGYLNNALKEGGYTITPKDVILINYAEGTETAFFTPSISNGIITLEPLVNPGEVILPVVSGDFAVFSGTLGIIADAGYSPTNAAKTKVIMANGATVANHIMVSTDTAGTSGNLTGTAINDGSIHAGRSTVAGSLSSFPAAATSGSLSLTAVANAGDFANVISNASTSQATTWTIPDPGAASASFLLSTAVGGQTISSSTTSATPGTIRALVGSMTGTAATMTSGNLVGTRGVVNYVGASGGFLYGAQGKLISTGTLSGSSWNACVFGQFDVSAATINGGQCSAIWGDWGTTGAVASDLTGCRGIAFTNTTSNVLNAQDYRYGNATYLMELAGAGGTLNYYLAAGTSAGSAGDATHCAAQQVIRIEINGVAAYIPVFTQNT